MEPFLKERFFNPSAGYAEARRVREAVEEARAGVAALLGASPEGIVFTSGGTEATNAAFRQMAREGKGVTVLSTDHDASLKTSVALGNGRMCSVDSEGRAVPEEWEALCAGEAGGVSFAWANNETGVLQDAAALCAGARRHGLPCIWMRCSVPERFPCACMGWMWIMRPFPPINCMVRRV